MLGGPSDKIERKSSRYNHLHPNHRSNCVPVVRQIVV